MRSTTSRMEKSCKSDSKNNERKKETTETVSCCCRVVSTSTNFNERDYNLCELFLQCIISIIDIFIILLRVKK